MFAPPNVAALGAVAALPAALPAVIASGVEARGAGINARVLLVGLLPPPVNVFNCKIECSILLSSYRHCPDCMQRMQLCPVEMYLKW